VSSLTGVENVRGSLFDDSLTGDSGRNVLGSPNGRDFLSGLAGNDTLLSGEPPASIDGGDGTDLCNSVADQKINCEL
jgi:Ca2+-binding RTX toxin-like protein